MASSLFTQGFSLPESNGSAETLNQVTVQRGFSSAVERRLHTADVKGSIPLTPTMPFPETTTHRGDVAELLAAAELLRRGYRVSRPLSNGTAYDLIVDDGRSLHRAQVKRAFPAHGGLRVTLCTSKYHRGRSRVLYEGSCEALIAVDCDAVKFYAFQGKELAVGEMRLRLEPTKNGQRGGVRHADDFELSRVFP